MFDWRGFDLLVIFGFFFMKLNIRVMLLGYNILKFNVFESSY
jgi:hypothetical protein